MSVIDEYLNNVSASHKTELERIRSIIHKTVPEAEEVISYGIPAFKYHKKYLIGFAAFKTHMSVFPGSEPVAAVKEKLANFRLSKGTIQFTKEHPIPEPILKEIIEHSRKRITTS
ncbi:MAG TPA: DUF1801 domain-containing protein [Candidatus Saccharimonadia bacterium]